MGHLARSQSPADAPERNRTGRETEINGADAEGPTQDGQGTEGDQVAKQLRGANPSP